MRRTGNEYYYCVMRFYALLIVLLLILAACSKDTSSPQEWCKESTIESLRERQETDPGSNTCATLAGKLVLRKDARCRSGAYYLEDSTGSLFLCDPSVISAQADSGVVACPSALTKLGTSDELGVNVRAEGLFFPAKVICKAMLCKCQNGLEVERIEAAR